MTIFIDLAGSWLIRASMVTVMLGLSITLNDAVYEASKQANTKAALASVADIVYTDVNMAGFRATPSTTFDVVSSNDMRFYGDINDDTVLETIRYTSSLDASTGLYKLYRTVNNENGGNPYLIGDFKSVTFNYYDAGKVPTTNPSSVASVRITLVVNVTGATTGWTTATNDFLVYPANLSL
jgi:hypothetical protein